MTLTIGTGPFSDQGEEAFNFEARAPKDPLLYYQRPQTQETISASSTRR